MTSWTTVGNCSRAKNWKFATILPKEPDNGVM